MVIISNKFTSSGPESESESSAFAGFLAAALPPFLGELYNT